VGDIASEAVLLGDGERLHQVPAGEIGAADITDLAAANEIVEGADGLLDRRLRIEAVQLEEIDIVGAEPAQAALDRTQQMVTRGADIVRPLAGAEGRLGRDDDAVAAAGDGLAQDLLGQAVGVDVGAVEHGEAGLEADIDQAGGLPHVAFAPGAEELVAATERTRAEAQCRHLESRSAQQSVFHGCDVLRMGSLKFGRRTQ
jgi:hypothetical protein